MDAKNLSGPNQENKQAHKRVWLPRLLLDILGNFSRATIVVVILITVVLSFLWNLIDYCELQKQELCKDILSFCSCILGFAITGFSIILTFNNCTIWKLSEPFREEKGWRKWIINTKSNPYDILCSSFSMSCILLLLTIIAVIIHNNNPQIVLETDWLFEIIKILSIVSAILVFDLLFHLYAVSTYLNQRHHQV